MKAVFPFLRSRRLAESALVAVGPVPGGVGIARVVREPDTAPVLDLCEFHAGEEPDACARILSRLAGARGVDHNRCATLVDHAAYTLLMVEAPDVPEAELRAAVRWRIKDLIDFPVEEAVIDIFDPPSRKNAGTGLIYAVVARAPMVRERIGQIEEAGFHLDVVDIPEMALRNVSALLPEDVGGVALVWLSASTGLVTLTRQGELYLSRRIEGGMGPVMESAARMQGGAEELPDDIRRWVDGIVIEVQRSLDYYESHFSQPPVTNVVFAPFPVPVPGLLNYFTAQLGVAARVMDVNAVIDCAERLDDETQAACLPLIGAGLRVEAAA